MIVDSEVTSIVINLSERSITIASNEGELKKVEWKWDEEGAEGPGEGGGAEDRTGAVL